MSAPIKLVIPGKPIAKKRPRFARRGNFVITYNEQQTEEGKWVLTARSQMDGRRFEGPVELHVFFEMPIPKSTSQKKRLLMERGDICHTRRPDLDNCIKFIKDCLNGEAWADDSQIVNINATKVYGAEPKTTIVIKER